MNTETKKFFELVLGYNGEKWDYNVGKNYEGIDHSYFLWDMEKMIDGRVGYPSLLYLMNAIAFVGYCANYKEGWAVPSVAQIKQKQFEDLGKQKDFISYCKGYLAKVNPKYASLAEELYGLVRHKLSHIYFTHNYVTTLPSINHLKKGYNKEYDFPYIWISVKDFLEDFKKSIESLYKELVTNEKMGYQFQEKQKFITDWAKAQQQLLNNMDLEETDMPTSSSFVTNTATACCPYTAPPAYPPYQDGRNSE